MNVFDDPMTVNWVLLMGLARDGSTIVLMLKKALSPSLDSTIRLDTHLLYSHVDISLIHTEEDWRRGRRVQI